MNREDGQWEYEMEAIKRRVEEREKEGIIGTINHPFKKGDWVWCAERLEQVGEIDPNGRWAMIRNAKHGIEMLRPVSVPLLIAIAKGWEEAYGTQQ